jgi:acyl carrier protein
LIRTAAGQHRFVLTNHHILFDGWSLPILLGEMFAGYYGQRLPAAAPYRRFVTWLAGQDHDAARAVWREVFDGFDTPTLIGPPDRFELGRRDVASFRVPEDTTRALGELARSSHSTVNVVLQGAWAVLLASLTGQHDVAFGTVVSGRPAELAGAESMVGLLINTVPVRARITASTTTADLLDQLQRAHNDTLEHEHLALNEIHRVTGQERLFDTVFVYENYPTDTAALSADHELAITEFSGRDYYHYPLAVQAGPGNELDLRVQYRADVFDVADIEALIERFTRVLEAMTSDPARRLSSIEGWSNRPVLAQGVPPVAHPGLATEYHGNGGGHHAPAAGVEQLLTSIYAQVLGLDRVGVDESFFDLGGDSLSAMRLIAAINRALDIDLAVPTVFDAPSVRSLTRRLGRQANSVDEVRAVSPAIDL